MTIAEEIAEKEEYLALLKQARKDLASAGLPIRIELGNHITSFSKIADVSKEIRDVENSLIILNREIY